MLRNYFVTAFRSLWGSKVHSIINVLGLGLGIAVCVLIALFVRDEWTFDAFHSKAERIYRVWGKENYGPDQVFFYTNTPFPMGPTLKENFEQIEAQVRVNPINSQIKIGDNSFSESISVVGEDFFSVFDFEVIAGDVNTVLHHQADLVITQKTAEKFFGKEDPINRVVSIQLGETYEEFSVKGVIRDIPANSSLQFDVLISDLNFPRLFSQRALTAGWFNISPETYVLLLPGTDLPALEGKFPALFKTIMGEDFEKSHYEIGLQPLTDIHLNTSFPTGIAPVSNPRYSYILSAIAALILIVACINFVTLSIGRSLKRAREVGIRKVVGAKRQQLIFQFIGEAVMVTIISLAIGVLLTLVNIPLFNDLSGKSLSLQADNFTMLVAAGLVILIGLIAGSYPALVLSSFKPIAILKGNIQSGGSKQGIRKSLVGIQLILSIFLISSTLVMQKQLTFLQNKKLGFNKEQLAVIQLNVPRVGRLTDRVKVGFEKAEQFKSELSKFPGVASVCGSSHDFGNGGWVNIGYTDDNGTYRTFNINVVDDDYITTLKIELKSGRNFSDQNSSDVRRAVIVNEAFVKEYGWTDAIGKRLPGKGFSDHEIIGVVKDFNYASLYTKVEPLLLTMDAAIPLSGMENINTDNSPIPKLILRLKPGSMGQTISEVQSVWKKLSGDEEFVLNFVNETMARQYRSDQNLGKMVGIATLLAILIGSLGLYGLASLAMQNRTKEISIRKVLGATEQSLLLLLSKDYVLMILICLVLSVPITFYLMNEWLKSFEFRVTIGPEAFLLAGGISLIIAILTISYQTIKTAWTKPADTLKYE